MRERQCNNVAELRARGPLKGVAKGVAVGQGTPLDSIDKILGEANSGSTHVFRT